MRKARDVLAEIRSNIGSPDHSGDVPKIESGKIDLFPDDFKDSIQKRIADIEEKIKYGLIGPGNKQS